MEIQIGRGIATLAVFAYMYYSKNNNIWILFWSMLFIWGSMSKGW